MSLLVGGGILAAFMAGSVALFSPCCIVFLLPAYLASAVKGSGWALFRLTIVFAAGLSVIILPLTLGMGLLAAFLTRFHTPLYLVGGGLMLTLGVLAIAGRSWSMPGLRRAPSLERTDAAGVFALGVFSGVASSCCAPVLAGVLTLSALAGSLPGALGLGLAYVFGMVFPLFLIALVWDRFRLGERAILRGRPLTLRVARRTVHTTTVNIVVGLAFLGMGAAVIALALTGNPMAAPGFQTGLGRALENGFRAFLRWVEGTPEWALGLGLLTLAGAMAWAGLRRARTDRKGSHDVEEEPGAADAPPPEAIVR